LKKRERLEWLTSGDVNKLLRSVVSGSVSLERVDLPPKRLFPNRKHRLTIDSLRKYYEHMNYPAMEALVADFQKRAWVKKLCFEDKELSLYLDLKSTIIKQERELKMQSLRASFDAIFAIWIVHGSTRFKRRIKSAGMNLYKSDASRKKALSKDLYDLLIDRHWRHGVSRKQIMKIIEKWIKTKKTSEGAKTEGGQK